MIKVHKAPQYCTKQSKHQNVPQLPTRMICVAPSGSGKTVLLISLILDIYPHCYERIYIFSPTVHVDRQWDAVKKFQKNSLKVDDQKEELYFDHYDEGALQNIIQQQHRVTKMSKERGMNQLYQILVILDDVADDPRITRSSKSVHELFVRGRHNCISTIMSVQKYRVIAPIIRVNATDLVVFRLRSLHELSAILEENSAVHGADALEKMYKMATEKAYGFLYIKLTASDPKDMFWEGFTTRLVPSVKDE